MLKISEFLIYFIIGVLMIFIGGAFWGLIIKILWNWLMVKIFGLCTITWLEGWGLSLLASSIFGGLRTSIDKREK